MLMERYKRDLFAIRDELTWEEMKGLMDKVHRMHSYGILHRDLFLKNTMYQRNAQGLRDIRIIDFGMAIPFEKEIPPVFRAIDFLNLISDLANEDLKAQCKAYIGTLVPQTAVAQGETWIKTHYDTCQSEYSLLKHVPVRWIHLMGPATVDTMVWSVRCRPDLDKDIIEKTQERIQQVESKFN
jgi:serine/threonine protein kinase